MPTPPSRPMKTLKKRSEFLAVAKGERATRRAFVLQAMCDPESRAEPRVGYTVTKRTGNSVERSRIKRRLRAAVAAVASDSARRGCDYVLVGRRAALDIAFSDLTHDLAASFRRVHQPRGPSGRGTSGPARPAPSDSNRKAQAGAISAAPQTPGSEYR